MKGLLILLTALPLLLKGQSSLILNGSFESFSNCPTDLPLGQINLATHWINPTDASPDYFNECDPPIFIPPDTYIPQMGVPSNAWGTQNASSGVAYGGFYAFSQIHNNIREYVQTELLETIVKQKPYVISFYVSLSDNSRYSTNTIGAYLSEEQITRNDMSRFEYVPQLINSSTNPLISKENWILITDTFISENGNEKFITIGNFNDDANSDTSFHNTDNLGAVYAYYYIDDVSVIPLDTTIGISESKYFEFTVYPNPNNGSFRLRINKADEKPVITITLFDMLGRVVFNEVGSENNLNITDITPGIYLLTVENNEYQLREKVIIN